MKKLAAPIPRIALTVPEAAASMGRGVDWFNEHLVVPRIDDERAVFLFKSSAKSCMRRIWSLLHGLPPPSDRHAFTTWCAANAPYARAFCYPKCSAKHPSSYGERLKSGST